MADLTARQLQWLRDTLGDQPPTEELQNRYDEQGSIRDVATSVLAKRRRALLDSALKVSAAGVASVDNTENVKALERDIASTFETFQLTRSRGR